MDVREPWGRGWDGKSPRWMFQATVDISAGVNWTALPQCHLLGAFVFPDPCSLPDCWVNLVSLSMALGACGG